MGIVFPAKFLLNGSDDSCQGRFFRHGTVTAHSKDTVSRKHGYFPGLMQ